MAGVFLLGHPCYAYVCTNVTSCNNISQSSHELIIECLVFVIKNPWQNEMLQEETARPKYILYTAGIETCHFCCLTIISI